MNCGAEHIFQPMIFLEIIRTDGITQLIPDGHRIVLTARTVTIHGIERTMRGKVVCRVISSCNQAREDVDLGFLLPIPLRGIFQLLLYKVLFIAHRIGDGKILGGDHKVFRGQGEGISCRRLSIKGDYKKSTAKLLSIRGGGGDHVNRLVTHSKSFDLTPLIPPSPPGNR